MGLVGKAWGKTKESVRTIRDMHKEERFNLPFAFGILSGMGTFLYQSFATYGDANREFNTEYIATATLFGVMTGSLFDGVISVYASRIKKQDTKKQMLHIRKDDAA